MQTTETETACEYSLSAVTVELHSSSRALSIDLTADLCRSVHTAAGVKESELSPRRTVSKRPFNSVSRFFFARASVLDFHFLLRQASRARLIRYVMSNKLLYVWIMHWSERANERERITVICSCDLSIVSLIADSVLSWRQAASLEGSEFNERERYQNLRQATCLINILA